VQIQKVVDNAVWLRVLNRPQGVGPRQSAEGDIVVIAARRELEAELEAASNVIL